MNVLDFDRLIHKCVNNVPCDNVYDKEDLYNECVVVLIKLLEKNDNNDSFISYAEKSMLGTLKNILKKSSRQIYEFRDEILSNIPEDELLESEYVDFLYEYSNDLDNFKKSLLFDVIINKEKKPKDIAKMYGHSEINIYNILNKIKQDFKRRFLNEFDN